MAYDVKIAPSAKRALEGCSVYGQADEIRAWIKSFTESASQDIEAGSIDVQEILTDILTSPEVSKKENWKRSWEFLRSANYRAKVQALCHIVSKRSPPVQLRATVAEFYFLGAFTQTVTAFYEVNHASALIVIRYFDGLPNQ